MDFLFLTAKANEQIKLIPHNFSPHTACHQLLFNRFQLKIKEAIHIRREQPP